jgi:hypothetical protein
MRWFVPDKVLIQRAGGAGPFHPGQTDPEDLLEDHQGYRDGN